MNSIPPWGFFQPGRLAVLLFAATRSLPRNYLGKRVFFVLRRVSRFILGRSPFDVMRFGARLRIHASGNVCEGRILFNEDHFDLEERSFLHAQLPDDAIFVDAGANIGGYSFSVAQSRHHANVLAIEANPDVFNRLQFNVAQNPLLSVRAFNYALAAEDGVVELFCNDGNVGESSLKVIGASGRTRQVVARTLLSVLRESGVARIDALKIDIEGAEDSVLGAFFAEAEPALYPTYILIEKSFALWDYDLLGLLKRIGYQEARAFRNNIALVLPPARPDGSGRSAPMGPPVLV